MIGNLFDETNICMRADGEGRPQFEAGKLFQEKGPSGIAMESNRIQSKSNCENINFQ